MKVCPCLLGTHGLAYSVSSSATQKSFNSIDTTLVSGSSLRLTALSVRRLSVRRLSVDFFIFKDPEVLLQESRFGSDPVLDQVSMLQNFLRP
jgi:hypothetical protein